MWGGERLPLLRGRCGWGSCLTHCSVRWRQKVPSTGTAVNRTRSQVIPLVAHCRGLGLGDKNHPFPWAVMGQMILYDRPTVSTVHRHIRWVSPLARQGQVQSRKLGLILDLPALPYPLPPVFPPSPSCRASAAATSAVKEDSWEQELKSTSCLGLLSPTDHSSALLPS